MAFLTERELILRGFSLAALERARTSGKLPFVRQHADPAHDDYGNFLYEDGAIDRWAAEENGVTKMGAHVKTARPSLAGPPASPARPSARPASAPQATGPATLAWQDAVEAIEGKGKTRRQAVAEVDQRQPGLRERMLAEVNA